MRNRGCEARGRRARRVARAAVLALLSLFWARALRASEPMIDGPGKEWRSGPVSLIITKEEDKNFKSLKTEEERKTAIEAFWAVRDTTTGTPRNEFKEDFYSRLKIVMNHFSENGPGWMSDEGRVYMIVGPPDDEVIETWGLVWVYTRTFPPGLKSRLAGKRAKVEIGFTRSEKIHRLIPEGVTLIDAVKKMSPPQAAAFVLSR